MHLSAPPFEPADRYDADAGGFSIPAGVFALVHSTDGDTMTFALGKPVAACLDKAGTAYVRYAVETRDAGPRTLRVVESDPPSVAACVTPRLERDQAWARNAADIAGVEVILRK
jgi:hypothetical protein